MVLLRVQDLEQGRRGVAPVVRAQLVDFVEHEHGVLAARLFHPLQNTPRQGAHVGAAMAADLGLVVHAAQGDAHKLAAQSPRNGTTERGLAHTGRAQKTKQRSMDPAAQLVNREVVEDAFFDVIQVVVILVEHGARGAQIHRIFARFFPRQLDQDVHVTPYHGRFGALGAHLLQASQLLVRLGAGVGRQSPRFDPLPQVLDLVAERIRIAQLVPNLAQLLAQVVVALGLGHFLFGTALNAVLHLQDSDFVLQGLVDFGQALDRIIHLQDGLRVLQLEGQIRSHQVRHAARLVHVLQYQRELGLHGAAQLSHPLHVLLHRAGQRFQLHRGGRRGFLHDI